MLKILSIARTILGIVAALGKLSDLTPDKLRIVGLEILKGMKPLTGWTPTTVDDRIVDALIVCFEDDGTFEWLAEVIKKIIDQLDGGKTDEDIVTEVGAEMGVTAVPTTAAADQLLAALGIARA